MKKWVVFGVVFIAAAILIAGCAEPTPPEPTPTPTLTPTETATPTETPAPLLNLIETLDERGEFTTLLAAIDAAGLTETLSTGEYTIFAPTDEAFDNLPEGLLDSLLEDPEGNLTQILLYHVIAGKRTAEENLGLQSVMTLQGESLEFARVDDVPTINGVAAITEFDIEAENGMIHVIDAVLVPPIAVPL